MSDDSYVLMKSNVDQSLDHETPFNEKKWNYVQDINNGVYTNGAQTLVQFDGSSIYNGGKYIVGCDLFIAAPCVRVLVLQSDAVGTAVAPTAESATVGNEFLTTMKAGYWNLLQSMEVVVNGVTIVQQTPNINFYNNFKMLSEMSEEDLNTIGPSLGISAIDSVVGYKFKGSAATTCFSGNGLSNNNIFPTVETTNAAGVANFSQQPVIGAYGAQAYNTGLYERSKPSAIGNLALTASATVANFNGTSGTLSLFNSTNVSNEFKSNFQILQTNYMVWFDTAIIRLKDVCDFFAKLPLMKNLDMLLRLYFNTGVVGVNLPVAQGVNLLSGSNTTFTNTCPFTINNAMRLLATSTVTHAVAGLFLQRATNTSMLGANLGLSGASHPMGGCRLYYSMVSLKPEIYLRYQASSRAKRILYTNVLYQNIANVTAGSLPSQLVQASVTRPKGVLLIPFISASTHGLNTGSSITVPFAPAISPWDTAPLTTPMSLTQLQVSIGGENQLMNYGNYTFEEFIQQVNVAANINSSDMGFSCGLFNHDNWTQGYRYYYVDCGRYNNSDALQPRIVAVQFMNNSLQVIDVACFITYLVENIIDCESGRILTANKI